MQTELPSELRTSWSGWAKFLHRHGLENLTAWALEAGGPLALLSAQVLYMGAPLLRPTLSNQQIEALASLLENGDEAHAFIAYLREEEPE